MRHLRWIVFGLAFLPACASTSSYNDSSSGARGPGGGAPPPAWTQAPARTMDGGYILFVGQGEDPTLERANFKATGMAIQDLVNECSFAPKGTRSEDHYETSEGSRYRAWVKISIQFEDCEAAKNAADPADIRRLANEQMAQELERYQDMIDEPEPEALASSGDTQGLNPALGNSQPASAPQVVAVNDTDSFFWTRQQVAYAKQVVILSPPGAYPPGAPETVAFVHQVSPAMVAVQRYEAANPAVRTWNRAYSGSAVRQQRLQSRRAAGPRAFGAGRRGNSYGGRGATGRKRRRWSRGR